jgi:toxin ParE1/3/4
MSARVRFLPEARADLHQIWDYIAEDDVEAATRLVDLVEEKCTLLVRLPDIGRVRDELAPGLRSFPVGKYVIFYRCAKGGIEIVRVLSGWRDIPALF